MLEIGPARRGRIQQVIHHIVVFETAGLHFMGDGRSKESKLGYLFP